MMMIRDHLGDDVDDDKNVEVRESNTACQADDDDHDIFFRCGRATQPARQETLRRLSAFIPKPSPSTSATISCTPTGLITALLFVCLFF